TPVADVDVSKESDSEPARKRTASRRVVKKKVTIFAVDNIIRDLDITLELGKYIILTKAAEEEAARKVHATHARIMTESKPEPTKKKTSRRSTRGVNKKLQILCKLLKKERKPVGDSQALKAQVKELSKYSEEDQGDDEEVDWIDYDEDEEKKDDTKDDKINDDEDKEMTNAEVEESRDGDEENTNVVKPDARNTEEVKDDAKKAKLSFDTSLVSTIKDTIDVEINSLLDIKIQYEVPHIQSPSVLRGPVSVSFEPSVLSPVPETPFIPPITTLPPLSVSTIPHVPHQTATPIHAQPITTDAPTITTIVPESDALTAV
ncbi:hypothetical protein Tco_1565453, partial [Tanacetum coccineum]